MAIVVLNKSGAHLLRARSQPWRAMPSAEHRRYITEEQRRAEQNRSLLDTRHPICPAVTTPRSSANEPRHSWIVTYHRPLTSLFRKTFLAHCTACDLLVPVGDDERYVKMVVYGEPARGRTHPG